MCFLWTAIVLASDLVTSASLSGRDQATCLNHCLPPSECRLFRCLPCLLSHVTLVCHVRSCGFSLTVLTVFVDLTSFWCAMVVVRRAGPCKKKEGFPTGLWTLSRLLYEPRFGMSFSHEGPLNKSYHLLLGVIESYAYSGYMLCSRLVFSKYLHQVLQVGCSILSFASTVSVCCLTQ